MKIEVLQHHKKYKAKKPLLDAYPTLERVKSLYNLHLKEKEAYVRYVVLLYSKDSILNDRRNFLPLEERKIKACKMLQMDVLDENEEVIQIIREELFELKNQDVFNAAFEYLIFQGDEIWAEIITIESEVVEFQMLRMKPMETKDDKDLMTATEKKDKLMNGVHQRLEILKKLKDEFFSDFDDVKKIAKERSTIESKAKPIHEFF